MDDIVRVGIDTGLHGAIAMLFPGGIWRIFSMPLTDDGEEVDGYKLRDHLAFLKDYSLKIAVEDPRGAEHKLKQGKQKQKGTADFFTRFGIVLGVLFGLNWLFRLVRPISWQTAAKKKRLDDKIESIQKALEYYPETKQLLLKDGSKTTYCDGKAEAVLLVHWQILDEGKATKKKRKGT